MNKIIKVLTSLTIVFLLSLVFTTPKVNAAISGDDIEELRGVWVSTVSNIDIAKQTNTTEKAINDYKAKLLSIIERVEFLGLNAIFFQIRPANDALYDSELNPYSKYLVGYGVNPGWDMLGWFIERCHERGIELHAWLNPYRVTGETTITDGMTTEEINQVKFNLRDQLLKVDPDCNNPLAIENDEEFLSTVVAGKEGKLILNPAKETSINHIVNSIDEIIKNYDVDGIHFDDYFYPSGGIEAKYDTADYQEYVNGGGTLDIKDWRRENVNKMIERVHETVEAHNSTNPTHQVAFGVSPAAVWAPNSQSCADRGQPGGMNVVCGSYSTYTDLYADTKKWVEEEWLDYILPQVYYPMGEDYKTIVKWWSEVVSKVDVKLYIGTAIYRVSEWSNGGEIKQQFEFIDSNPTVKKNVSGFVLFSYRNLISPDSYMTLATNNIRIYCAKGALHPVYNINTSQITKDPEIKIYQLNGKYSVQFKEVPNANGYILYGIPKGQAVDFNASTTAIKNAYNQATGDYLRVETINATTLENFDYYLRVFDANNKEHAYYKVDFENAIQNEGAKITVLEFNNESSYEIGEEVIVKFKAESEVGLPLTVYTESSIDGSDFSFKSNLTADDDGIYTYKYSPFKEGLVRIRITANDTDVDSSLILGPITVGSETLSHTHTACPECGLCTSSDCDGKDTDKCQGHEEHIHTECPTCGLCTSSDCDGIDADKCPGHKTDGGNSGSSCNFGAYMILPLTMACALILIRKRD